MTDIYSSAHKQPGIDLSEEAPLEVKSANITVESRAFAGDRWYTIAQQGKEGVQAVAASTGELKELVSVLQEALYRSSPVESEQLRLFDPDNPPEAPRDSRLDPAN